MKLKVEDIQFIIEKTEIIKGVSFDVPKGTFVGIIGPNGSGKSTLLKNIYGLYKPNSGQIFLDANNLVTMKEKNRAKELAVLSQESSSAFDFTVAQIVEMGRYPYKGLFEEYSKDDFEIVNKVIREVGLEHFKDRSFLSLSGGEKQRVLIARALAQNTDFLILDEPTNHLDIGYQIQLMDVIKGIQVTTLAAIHDINLAAMYCDYLIVMKNGQVHAAGKVEEVITEELLKLVFRVNGSVSVDPNTGKPHVTYKSSLKL